MQDTKVILTTFGNKVKELRKQKGLTQRELALLSGYDGAEAISKIERGVIGIPQYRVVAIADALGVSPASFFGDSSVNGYICGNSDYSELLDAVHGLDTETLEKVRQTIEIWVKRGDTLK